MNAPDVALGFAYGITVGLLVRTLLDAGEKAARNAPPKARS